MGKKKGKKKIIPVKSPMEFFQGLTGKMIEISRLCGEYDDPILPIRGRVRTVFGLDTDIPELILRETTASGSDTSFVIHIQYVFYNEIFKGYVDNTTSRLYKIIGDES